MNDLPDPAAPSYTPVQTSTYKASAAKEGFICSAIWAAFAIVLGSGLTLWTAHAHPEKGVVSAEAWAHMIGFILGRFLQVGICLSAVVFYRRRKNVTSFIFLDWRWWLVCAILALIPNQAANPLAAWVWVGLIYQARASIGR